MLRKTTLSKILSAAIAAITVISPLAVSADHTSSQKEESNPETTKVSSQEAISNSDFVPPTTPTRKRRSTGTVTTSPSSAKKIKSTKTTHTSDLPKLPPVNLPYNVIIKLEYYNEKEIRVRAQFNCKVTQLTEIQKDLIKKFHQKIREKCDHMFWNEKESLGRSFALNDIANSEIIFFSKNTIVNDQVTNINYFIQEIQKVINYISEEVNIKFDSIELSKQ